MAKETEHESQCLVIEWAEIMSHQYPALKMLFAIGNGELRPYKEYINKKGKKVRYSVVGQKLKRQGVKSGVPDLCLASWGSVEEADSKGFPYQKQYPLLYIEMKSPKGKVSKNQEWWLKHLTEQGYLCEVCYSADEAIEVIKNYLGMEV